MTLDEYQNLWYNLATHITCIATILNQLEPHYKSCFHRPLKQSVRALDQIELVLLRDAFDALIQLICDLVYSAAKLILNEYTRSELFIFLVRRVIFVHRLTVHGVCLTIKGNEAELLGIQRVVSFSYYWDNTFWYGTVCMTYCTLFVKASQERHSF